MVGVTGLLMTCISDIKCLSAQSKHDGSMSIQSTANDLFARLEHCEKLTLQNMELVEDDLSRFSKHEMMSFYHLKAFIAATYIYLYQTLYNLPPNKLSSYVNDVFYNVQAFKALDEGNCSLWPAFIAAVAACEDEDIESARAWLDRASKTEMGDRIHVKSLVEEVWRVRETAALEKGLEPGSINVDLSKVIDTLKLDTATIALGPGPRFPPFEQVDVPAISTRQLCPMYCY